MGPSHGFPPHKSEVVLWWRLCWSFCFCNELCSLAITHVFVAPHGWRIPSGNGGSSPCPVPMEGKALSKPALRSLSDKGPAFSQESLSPLPDKGFLFIFLPSGCLGWMLAILYAYFFCCFSRSKGPGEELNQTCGAGASAAQDSSLSHLDV